MFSNIYEQEQTKKVTRHVHVQIDNMNHIGLRHLRKGFFFEPLKFDSFLSYIIGLLYAFFLHDR